MQQYVDALRDELVARAPSFSDECVDTIYWGGGTPSQLSPDMLASVFSVISDYYNVSGTAEITIEANPDDLSESYLLALSRLPFNRISLGVQSFSDDELKMLNRRHTAEEAASAVARCRLLAGINNISIDLMYGLPGQTIAIWSQTLDKALSLGVQHISAYHLTYEKGTAFYARLCRNELAEVDEELSLSMFELLRSRLSEAGFVHYEISNFALPGFRSRHNSSYWSDIPYLGIGAAAHSFVDGRRSWNVSDLNSYIEQVEMGSIMPEYDDCNEYTRYNDFVMTSLRTCDGLSLKILENKFGAELSRYCLAEASVYLENGSLIRRGESLYLSDNALFLSDAIISSLLFVND